MKWNIFFNMLAVSGVLIGSIRLIQSCSPAPAGASAAAGAAEKPVDDPVARGRYLVRIAGCNDCHTPGFMEKGEAVPESEWLTGVPVGWQGPWGTTWASNLRRHLLAFPDAGPWIGMVKSRQGLPPMPWPGLHAMSDADLRAVHAYIRSLEVRGDQMPAPVPPGQEPPTPYLRLVPVLPGA